MEQNVLAVRANSLTSRSLHLILMPTEKCNFRCTYCYEDFKIGRMAPSVVNGIKTLIGRRVPSLTSIHIGWFGGEPTLAPDIVENINSAVLIDKPANLSFSSSMSTNGWLLNGSLLDRMLDAGITTFQISLDGDIEEHDRTRLQQNGTGSFDRIMHNLETAALSDRSFRMSLRLHVHKDNLSSIGSLIDRLHRRFGEDKRFVIYAKRIDNMGDGVSINRLSLLDDQRAINHINRYIKDIGMFESDSKSMICYAAQANSLVIRADGRIAKCTVAFQDQRNTVGSIDEMGELSIDHARFTPWIRGVLTGDMAAMACPLNGLPA